MKTLKYICLALIGISVFVVPAEATWSIIVIDAKTKEIGIAGASCTYSVYGIGAIVPGKGAIVVQAMSNPFARAKGVRMLIDNAAPEEILKAIKDPTFDPEEQQYAVMSLNHPDKPLTYTGTLTPPHKGSFTQKGISVQGNTLADPAGLQAVLKTAAEAQRKSFRIEETLILALEEGAKSGGDKRCGASRASSAFLTVAKPDDDLHHPSLNLVIYGTDEKANAVEALRQKYNQWKSSQNK